MKQKFLLSVLWPILLCACTKTLTTSDRVDASSVETVRFLYGQKLSQPILNKALSTTADTVPNNPGQTTLAVFTTVPKPGFNIVITGVSLRMERFDSFGTMTWPFSSETINDSLVARYPISESIFAAVKIYESDGKFRIICLTGYGVGDPDAYVEGEHMTVILTAIRYKCNGKTQWLKMNEVAAPTMILGTGDAVGPPPELKTNLN